MALEVNLLKVEQNQVISIKTDSVSYPWHEFSVGHFESSFNPSGFNTVLDKIANETLYTILGGTKDELITKPNWNSVSLKITETLKKIESYLKDYGGYFKATVVFERDEHVDSEEKALKTFRQEYSKYKKNPLPDFGNYTSEQGEFVFADPWKVLAIIPGTRKVGQKTNKCVYVIHEVDLGWYLQALQIMQETVSFVLAQPNIESYQLQWSH